MKKMFTSLSITAMFTLAFSVAHGQLLEKGGTSLTTTTNTSQSIIINGSPNLGHNHDGEHCISDALTNDWINSQGIADQYKAEETHQNNQAHFPQGARATYTIPIIFHVIHNPNNPAENVSEADINALLDAVNLDFTAANADIGDLRTGFGWTGADADIEFCLAQKDPMGNQLTELGIHRVSTNEDFYDPNSESNKMKGDTGGDTGTPVWDRNSYVNVWICDITNGAGSGVAGYAYKPTTTTLPPASIDGIVIDYNLGMTPSARVLTHEIGHYLGLAHTWGDSNQQAGCTADDGLADTPVTAGPSFDFPGSCSGSQQTCAGTETQYENFMDYASCTVIYTQDQANLMAAVLTGSRSSLLTSDACTPINPQPPVADFVADITTVQQGGSINFTDLSTNYPTGWTWTIAPMTGVSYILGTDANTQNPTVQFNNTGTYTVTLNASNAYGNDDEVKTSYITVVASGAGTIDCDTLRNWNPSSSLSAVSGSSGLLMGNSVNGSIDITGWAEEYTFSSNTNIRRLRFLPWRVNDAGGSITFNIYNDNNGGEPGTVLASTTMALADMNEDVWTTVDFAGTGYPVSAGQTLFIGYEPSYVSTDSFALRTNFNGTGSPASETFLELIGTVDGPWHPVVDIYTINSQPANTQFILDVLVSDGPAPTALAAWPLPETCAGMEVTMNGFGSTNADSYYWDITDGSNDYYYDEGNLTTPFNAGTWTISLEADGSCMTDIDGPFVLTVNPALTGSYSITDENCIAADGGIVITLSGGDGGPYQYSINNGATFQGSNTYSNLIAGDYTYVFTDGGNCEVTGTVTVGNINNFSPTITPDAIIAPGTPTDLTVTGGTSWTWYANDGGGPLQVGTTQTINVAPTVTTTYHCNVEDGSGCEAELEVTLTMESAGINELFGGHFQLFPNPSDGQFQLMFHLNETKDIDVEIVNIIGDKVFASSFSDVKDQTIGFDLNHIATGVYFVTLKSGEEMVTEKIVIK
jgi:PKD repeat protein